MKMDLVLLKQVWAERMQRPERFQQLAARYFGDMLQEIHEATKIYDRQTMRRKLEIANRALCEIALSGDKDPRVTRAIHALEAMADVSDALPLYDGEERMNS